MSEPTIADIVVGILHADEREMGMINNAIKARRNVLKEEKKLRMQAELYVGSTIYLNGNVSPKMLEWQPGVIERFTEEGYVIRLDRPPSEKWRGLIEVKLHQIELRP